MSVRSKAPILFGEPLSDDAMGAFRAAFADIAICPSPGMPTPDLCRLAEGKRALVLTVRNRMTPEFFQNLPQSVAAVGTYSAGLDHVDLAAARARGVAVLNTPDVLTASVADLAMMIIVASARRVREGIELLQSGQWKGWRPDLLIGSELGGKTLGVFGMGKIGRAVARRAAAFDMRIAYLNRSRLPAELEGGAEYVGDEAAFLARTDFLLIAAPSTPETKGFVNAWRIAAMKPGAAVINIARGDLVDDDALIAALKSGRLSAAGLDVFNNEPAIDPRYRELRNVFALPHMGSSTTEARRAMAEILVSGIGAVLRGERPVNRVV